MRVHKYQVKEISSTYGIPIKRYTLCHTADRAMAAYHRMGVNRVAIKAQVLTGGRGKTGGVKLANNDRDVYQYAQIILEMTIKGYLITKILLSEAVNVAAECYISFTIDRSTRSVTLIMSAAGGMDIKGVVRQFPGKIIRCNIDPLIGVPDYLAHKFAFSLFEQAGQTNWMTTIIQGLYKTFIEEDASLTEINPLVLTPAEALLTIDAKMVFDGNALYRHLNLQKLSEPTEDEELEATAKERGLSYVRMDGEIGCMVNGAGLAMTAMDMIKLYGRNPTDLLDTGGSSNPIKVIKAMRLLLDDGKVKVVFINTFGGITRCDDVAIGLLQVFEQIQTDIPIIVRSAGTSGDMGRELLRKNNRFQVAQTVEEATKMTIGSLEKESI